MNTINNSSLYNINIIENEINISTTLNGGSLTYTFIRNDSFGDGGLAVVITDSQGTQVLNLSQSPSYSSTSDTFSVMPGETYTITLDADSWPSEISYQVIDENGIEVLSAGPPVYDGTATFTVDGIIVNGSVCQFINNKYEYSSSTYVTANKQYWVKCKTAGVLTLFNGVEILNSDNNPNYNYKFTIQNIRYDNNVAITNSNFGSEFIFKCEVLDNNNESLSPPYFADTTNALVHFQNNSMTINEIKDADFSNHVLAFSGFYIDQTYLTSNYYNNLVGSTIPATNMVEGQLYQNVTLEAGLILGALGVEPHYTWQQFFSLYLGISPLSIYTVIQHIDGV